MQPKSTENVRRYFGGCTRFQLEQDRNAQAILVNRPSSDG